MNTRLYILIILSVLVLLTAAIAFAPRLRNSERIVLLIAAFSWAVYYTITA